MTIRMTSHRAADCPSTILVRRLRVLEDDALDDVGDALAAVRRVLEDLVEFLPLDHVQRILRVFEKLLDALEVDLVGFVLEPVDLDEARIYPARVAEYL